MSLKNIYADQEEVVHVEEQKSIGCGILGRYPILSVVGFAAVGVGVGLGLSYWEPDNEQTKDDTIKWIGLVGDLFIRALKAVVLPLVFVNVVVSVVDMMSLGRASSVGWKTIALYTLTTLIASTIGLIAILSFQSLFTEGDFDDPEPALVQLGCTAENYFVSELDNGNVACSMNATTEATKFKIEDISGTFMRRAGSNINDEFSMSDTVYEGVFLKLITDNVFFSFVDGNFAAVIFFAIVFGVALGRVVFNHRKAEMSESYLVTIFQETSDVLLTLINWIIAATPFAVLSLIAQAIGSQDDLNSAFANVGYLIAANLFGFVMHFLITDIGLFYLLSRSNPFEYLRHMVPAQTTALACASSAATLPVTLRCVKNTGKVPDDIRNFVCPLGATINMDGSAIYFPCACIWLAILNGIDPGPADYILLIILSTVGSAGAAPVPSSGLVLVITAYNTVFGGSGTPNGFEFVVAIDWFLDRCITALNVTGDSVVAGIIASRTPLEEFENLHKDETTKTTAFVNPDVSSASASDDVSSSNKMDEEVLT